MVVTKIERITKFEQNSWVRKKKAKKTENKAIEYTEFQKPLPKDMSTELYGKTM